MYNRQLDAFMKVAELGSFSKAAEANYVSPSAILQQVKNLEENLGARLFQRTHRGTKLTPAGEILYAEAPRIIAINQEIRARISALKEREYSEICVGTSPIEQCTDFYRWWNLFLAEGKEYRVRFKAISGIGNREEWNDVDLREGVYVGDLDADKFRFLALKTVPIVHAVWKNHPFAQKEILRYEDMRGQTIVVPGGKHLIDRIENLRSQAQEYGINVITKDYFDISTFTMCVANGYIIQIPLSAQYAHSEMIAIPCDWDYTLPYGFYYRFDSSPLLEKFISFILEHLHK